MPSSSRPAPIFLLAGHHGPSERESEAMHRRILSSAGVETPSIAYIGAASGDNRGFFAHIASYLESFGAGSVTLAPLVGKSVRLDRTRAMLESANIVFVSGGDVEEGMDVLNEREMIPFLHELHASGKPFVGMSAGSIMLAHQWVRWDDPDDESSANAFPCIGLAPILCDTHGEDEDWEELRALLELSPSGTVGYGIPSGAALCVQPDGAVESLASATHCFQKKGNDVIRIADLPESVKRKTQVH